MADDEEGGWKDKARAHKDRIKSFFSRAPKEDKLGQEEERTDIQVGKSDIKHDEKEEQSWLDRRWDERREAKAEAKRQIQAEKASRRVEGYKKRRSWFYGAIKLLIILAILYFIFIILIFPNAGAVFTKVLTPQIGSDVEATMVSADAGISNQLRGGKGGYSNIKQTVYGGKPQQWDAIEIHADQVVNPNAGVAVRDLYAVEGLFAENELQIKGTLDAVSTFVGEDVTLYLEIVPEETSEPLNDNNWVCEIDWLKGEDIFTITEPMTERGFTCTHPPIDDDSMVQWELFGETGKSLYKRFKITFQLKHNTQAMVTKNLFVTDAAIALMPLNPAAIFKIDPEETVSKPITDGKTIELSMGLAKGSHKTFIKKIFSKETSEEISKDSFIPAVAEQYSSKHNQYLGVGFRAKSYESSISIHSLNISLPDDPAISILPSTQFDTSKCNSHLWNGQYPMIKECPINEDYRSAVLTPLEQGTSEAVYLKFYVRDEYLGSGNSREKFEALTALAEIDYDYIYKKAITMDVKKLIK